MANSVTIIDTCSEKDIPVEPSCAASKVDDVVPAPKELLGLPSPLRYSRDTCVQTAVASESCVSDAPEVCADLAEQIQCSQSFLLSHGMCQIESVSQFLILHDLAKFSNSCVELRESLTVAAEEPRPTDEDTESSSSRARLLRVPIVELKTETAEEDISRMSLSHARVLRVWNHRTLDVIIEALEDVGGPQVLHSLERIAFKGCPMTMDYITAFTLPVFSHAQLLKHLNLEKNQVTDDIMCDLVSSGAFASSRLETMNLRFNKIGNRGAAALASCSCCDNLKWINFKMNLVGDEGALALANMLSKNSSMHMLNLRRQMPGLSDKAANGFANMLRSNSTLEQLRLRRNRIGDAGAMVLAEASRDRFSRIRAWEPGFYFELDLETNRIKAKGVASLLLSLSTAPEKARIELLVHGNSVDRADLAPMVETLSNGDEKDKVDIDDTRLWFHAKNEGAL